MSIEEYSSAQKQMMVESDRGAAIIGAAMVEDALRGAIQASLPNTKDMKSLFHDQGSPFGTFSNKITASIAMGIINEKTADRISDIRHIRNAFSHAIRPLTFDQIEIKSMCLKFVDMCSADNTSPWDGAAARFAYHMGCSKLVGEIFEKSIEIYEKQLNINQPGTINAKGSIPENGVEIEV